MVVDDVVVVVVASVTMEIAVAVIMFVEVSVTVGCRKVEQKGEARLAPRIIARRTLS